MWTGSCPGHRPERREDKPAIWRRAPGRGYTGGMSPFQRHIDACNNLPSPAGYIPFRIAGVQVGWLSPDLAQALTFFPRDFHFDAEGVALAGRLRSPGTRTEALATVAKSLAGRGYLSVRGEPFDVRAPPSCCATARRPRHAAH
ncbi:MAG: DUF4743 domain-containing protein, partial [Acetobacteraceae bacterium]